MCADHHTDGKPNPLFQRILVAVDDSVQSEWAVKAALSIAQDSGAYLALVHTYLVLISPQETALPFTVVESQRCSAGMALLEQHRAQLGDGMKCELFCVEAQPAHGIVETARRWNADLIVMGTHGRGRLAQLLLGSTAETVIRRAPCPVMTVSNDPADVAAPTYHAAASDALPGPEGSRLASPQTI